EFVAVLGEQLRDLGVRVIDETVQLFVYEPLRLRRALARARKQRALTVAGNPCDRPELLAHPPPPDHFPRDLSELLQIRLRAGADLPVDDLLGDASAERDLDLGFKLLPGIGDPVGVWCREGHTQRHSAWNDRHLANGIRFGREHPDERMP